MEINKALVIIFVMILALEVNGEEAKSKREIAMEKFKSGDIEGAKELYEELLKEGDKEALYNLGVCEARLGRYGLAIERFEEYLKEKGEDLTEEKREEIEDKIDALKKLAGKIKIEVKPEGIQGLKIEIGGREIASGEWRWIRVGRHKLEVKAEGYKDWSDDIKVIAGKEEVITVELKKEEKEAVKEEKKLKEVKEEEIIAKREVKKRKEEKLEVGEMERVKRKEIEGEEPIYKRWWFWTIVGGVVLVGGGVGAVLAITKPFEADSGANRDIWIK